MNSNSSLVGSQYEGRVEVNYGNRWGTICSNQWTIEDALVVCRMLGFTSASRAITNGRYGPGTGMIWLSNVNCVGSETSLLNCTYSGWGNTGCDHTQDAGVVCSDGELRFVHTPFSPPPPPPLHANSHARAITLYLTLLVQSKPNGFSIGPCFCASVDHHFEGLVNTSHN